MRDQRLKEFERPIHKIRREGTAFLPLSEVGNQLSELFIAANSASLARQRHAW